VLSNWLPFLFYALFAAAIPASLIAFSFLLPRRPVAGTRQKLLPFESGVSQEAPTQERRFTVQFYLVAILYMVFAVEIVFLYPLAVVLGDVGWFAFGAAAFFLAALVIPLVYDWRKGALDWN
jgi:NADH-quinone oxidoreductase subunit A